MMKSHPKGNLSYEIKIMKPEDVGEKMDVEHEMINRFYMAQLDDLKNQLQEAWGAVAFWSQMDYNEAILFYLEEKKALEVDEALDKGD